LDVRFVLTRQAAAVSALIIFGALAAPARPAAAQSSTAQAPTDSAAAAAVVERYHRALAVGDSAGALALLADDAVILESGDVESREEYRAHHLPADIAFARAVKGDRSAVRVTVRGDVAWATSTSTSKGQYRGRAINSAGAELVVLARDADGWKISAIHWSSHSRRS
jgi:ketosteroid isomerase-like protein